MVLRYTIEKRTAGSLYARCVGRNRELVHCPCRTYLQLVCAQPTGQARARSIKVLGYMRSTSQDQARLLEPGEEHWNSSQLWYCLLLAGQPNTVLIEQ